MKKKVKISVVLIFTIFFLTEIYLRCKFGFCHAPLYVSSNTYEYVCAPNQEDVRFGNYYYYNSYSMRGPELRDQDNKYLLLGDSVVNGGVLTDQSELASTIVSKDLDVQLLNISAGSWGPDNCYEFLSEKGDFDARGCILVVSSHDVYDDIDFTPVVGIHASYPDQNYHVAILELFNRYLLPRIRRFFESVDYGKDLDPDQKVAEGIIKKGVSFNVGFESLRKYFLEKNVPFVVYLHPEQSELIDGEYNSQGKRIIEWARLNNVKLFLGLSTEISLVDYRDVIHLNKSGQYKLSQSLEVIVKSWMPGPLSEPSVSVH